MSFFLGCCDAGEVEESHEERLPSLLTHQARQRDPEARKAAPCLEESKLATIAVPTEASSPPVGPPATVPAGGALHPSSESALLAALREFRSVAASQELQKLGRPCGALDEAGAERLRRITASYQAHAATNFGDDSRWAVTEKNENLKLEWGYEVKDGYMTFFNTLHFDAAAGDASLAKAVSGIWELDFWHGFKEDFVRAERLKTEAANATIWRLVTHDHFLGSKVDDIWALSFTDALDEPSGAFFIDAAIVKPGVSQLRGAQIPGPDPGFARTEDGFFHYRFVPTSRTSKTYTMVSFGRIKINPTVRAAFAWMPGFVQRRLMRYAYETSAQRMREHFSKSAMLEKRLKSSGSAAIYQHIAARMAA